MTSKPYTGPCTTIVIAIDIGTTFSGVSYAVLHPGELPVIQGVTRFPDQDRVAGDKKVPSIMYYDKTGHVRAAGATVQDETVIEEADEKGWSKVELFKLHLRPASIQLNTNGLRLGSLPPSKTPIDVLGDFLKYLFRCTIDFIQDTHVDGSTLWRDVEDRIEFVLSHPNGWEGQQQQKMRQGAVHGGLIPDTPDGHSRLKFVTEGEACLHACLASGLGPRVLRPGHAFIIADAGGGTLDINTYEICVTQPLQIEEIVASDCRFAGSIFVNRSARSLLQRKLRGTQYGADSTIDHILDEEFDRTTKRLFADSSKLQFVKVGGAAETKPKLGIRGGKLKLDGTDVAACFDFSIHQAVDAITQQKEAAGRETMEVWLVGGFAASPWLFQQLKARLAPLGITVYRPDANTSKAVADGAVSFYLDRWVTTRVARLSCGVMFGLTYNPLDHEHLRRQHLIRRMPSGRALVYAKFSCYVTKGTKVAETKTISMPFSREITSLVQASLFEVPVHCYHGILPIPHWRDDNPESFEVMCMLRADLSMLCRPSFLRRNGTAMYWQLEFEVEVKFGCTEYEGRIKWNENGNVFYGPVSLIYEDNQSEVSGW